MNQFMHRKFVPQYKATIGAGFFSKDVLIDNQLVSFQVLSFFHTQIWDTAGQERFQSLGTSFYRGADCCILVYDITQPKSFEAIGKWKDAFITNAGLADPVGFPFLLMGNKLDQELERRVPSSKGVNWCKQNGGITFLETSAKDQTNVMEGFINVGKLALQKKCLIKPGLRSENVKENKKLTKSKPKNQDKCEC